MYIIKETPEVFRELKKNALNYPSCSVTVLGVFFRTIQ